jgi:hypothetical protein
LNVKSFLFYYSPLMNTQHLFDSPVYSSPTYTCSPPLWYVLVHSQSHFMSVCPVSDQKFNIIEPQSDMSTSSHPVSEWYKWVSW